MPRIKRQIIGRSVEGRAIEAFLFDASEFRQLPAKRTRGRTTQSIIRNPQSALVESVLVLAGVHGDEPKGVYAAERLNELLAAHPELHAGARVTIVPRVNPDGCARYKRRNAHKVDLNRNMPTRDWSIGKRHSRYYGGAKPESEPETRALVRLVERLRPARIVSIHSITRRRQCNNWNGPAKEIAERMSALNGYPVTDDIGYPTPGSFGTWAGAERRIPTITLEFPSHHSRQRCWRENRAALLAFIQFSPH